MQERYLGIGTMTALLEKTVDLAHLRAIELEEAHRKAEIASEAKSRFLATMSHELRTPLNAIIGFAELLLMRDVEQMASGQRRGYIADIRNSGAHLLALINDILDYSKLEADHLPLSETVFDLRQFLHDERAPGARAGGGRRRHAASADAAGDRAQGRRAAPAPMRGEPAGQRHQVRAARRGHSVGGDGRVRPASRSGSPTPAAASRPTSSNGCSSPSTRSRTSSAEPPTAPASACR